MTIKLFRTKAITNAQPRIINKIIDRQKPFKQLKSGVFEGVLAHHAYTDTSKFPKVIDKFENADSIAGTKLFYEEEYRLKIKDALSAEGTLKERKANVKALLAQKERKQNEVIQIFRNFQKTNQDSPNPEKFNTEDFKKLDETLQEKGIKIHKDFDKGGWFGKVYAFMHEGKDYAIKLFPSKERKAAKAFTSGQKYETNSLFYLKKYNPGYATKLSTSDFSGKFQITDLLDENKPAKKTESIPLHAIGLHWGDNRNNNLIQGKVVDAGVMNRISIASKDSKLRNWMIKFSKASHPKRLEIIKALPDNPDNIFNTDARAISRLINHKLPPKTQNTPFHKEISNYLVISEKEKIELNETLDRKLKPNKIKYNFSKNILPKINISQLPPLEVQKIQIKHLAQERLNKFLAIIKNNSPKNQ